MELDTKLQLIRSQLLQKEKLDFAKREMRLGIASALSAFIHNFGDLKYGYFIILVMMSTITTDFRMPE